MKFKAPPGVFDILPCCAKDEWKQSHIWSFVEGVMRETAAEYGFEEIRTPILEKTELFQRGVGETSDIVSKEMYTFFDRGGRSLSLRPEGTAPTIRSYLENNLAHRSNLQKLYYIGPMFRYERSQAGRYRQHHQFGAEAIGTHAPEQDAEIIDLLYTTYQRLGLKNLQVMINSLGTKECRHRFRSALKEYFQRYSNEISEDSKIRLEKNPLRILDSKHPKDQEFIANAPSILDYLSKESYQHFEHVQKFLALLDIPFVINPRLVRGLDYYNQTVFEVSASELGAQNSIGGGGRYDHLIKELGGSDRPALGFGTGIERIIQTMIRQKAPLPNSLQTMLFMIPLGERAKDTCFKILHDLRRNHIVSQMDITGRKLNKSMSYANQIGAKFVVVIGDQELDQGYADLKNMAKGRAVKVPLNYLARILQIELEEDNLIKVWTELSKPFEDPLEAQFFHEKIKSSITHTQQLTNELQKAMKKMETFL